MNKEMLSTAEAAEALSLSKATILQLVHRDDFPSLRIGRRILIPRRKLLDWIDNHCGEQI